MLVVSFVFLRIRKKSFSPSPKSFVIPYSFSFFPLFVQTRPVTGISGFFLPVCLCKRYRRPCALEIRRILLRRSGSTSHGHVGAPFSMAEIAGARGSLGLPQRRVKEYFLFLQSAQALTSSINFPAQRV